MLFAKNLLEKCFPRRALMGSPKIPKHPLSSPNETHAQNDNLRWNFVGKHSPREKLKSFCCSP